MSGSSKKGGSAGRQSGKQTGLSAEDRALWEKFAEAVKPANAKPRVADVPRSADLKRDSRETISEKSKKSSEKDAKRAPVGRLSNAPGKPTIAPEASRSGLDRKHVKKLGKGRVAIDARIDLHGLRQTEAHDALGRFLRSSVAKGYRNVLVITGKGRADDDQAHWAFDPARQAPGVLRRSVPNWLAGADFRDLVAGFTTAHFRHGGDGAYYVQLRRPKRPGERTAG